MASDNPVQMVMVVAVRGLLFQMARVEMTEIK